MLGDNVEGLLGPPGILDSAVVDQEDRQAAEDATGQIDVLDHGPKVVSKIRGPVR